LTRMNGGQIIVDYLIQENVSHAFGLCGHGNISFIDASPPSVKEPLSKADVILNDLNGLNRLNGLNGLNSFTCSKEA